MYMLQVTDSPKHNFFREFERMLNQFLWKGKKAKIRRKMLQGGIDNGGRKLVNLQHKDTDLKLTWLFKANEVVQSFIQKIIPQELGEVFWDCCLNVKDADQTISGQVGN